MIECLAGGWGPRVPECEAIREYARYSSVSFIPDEGFFQTLLLNSPFCHTVRLPPAILFLCPTDTGHQRRPFTGAFVREALRFSCLPLCDVTPPPCRMRRLVVDGNGWWLMVITVASGQFEVHQLGVR